MTQPTKYVFVTGGVLSGLGKGITAASIANLLKARGLNVNLQKCDPYLNVDAGLLNPREHGECFVTKDGAETDLDLGHYERFIDQELEDTGVAEVITKRLSLDGDRTADLTAWREMVKNATHKHPRTVKVGVIAKYLDNTDTYMSVFEALRSAAWANDTNIDIEWIDAEKLETEDIGKILDAVDGIVVPGGFGSRGVEGKIKAAQYALTHKKPYLGLCYGLHMAVIAAARLGGLEGANTTEADSATPYAVINTMEGQEGKQNTGGTMRLGNYDCDLTLGSLAEKVYGAKSIVERHRHRYECMAEFVPKYESWGIRPVGVNPQTKLVEIIEGVDHPFFMASQFHPEFKSRPTRPHPMFDGFIASLVVKK
jgi:CTP synthase